MMLLNCILINTYQITQITFLSCMGYPVTHVYSYGDSISLCGAGGLGLSHSPIPHHTALHIIALIRFEGIYKPAPKSTVIVAMTAMQIKLLEIHTKQNKEKPYIHSKDFIQILLYSPDIL